MNVFELFGTIAIKNRDANAALTDTAKRAERTGNRIQAAFKKIGEASVKIAKPIIAGATAAATAFAATIEKTRDYRTEMAKLDTAFQANGHSSETAMETYKALQKVLGETDQAVEAANHLAVLCDNQEDLAKWTDICTGVFATFGDSLPIEGLTESANETAKVGQVTGSLADALNWAGISEDDFNKKLQACTSEEKRQELIMDTLYWTYKKASDQYKETAASVMEANAAQERLNAAMAKLGEIGEPLMSAFKIAVADMVTAAAPYLETLLSDMALVVTEFGNVITWAKKAAAAVSSFFGAGNSGGMITFGGVTIEENHAGAVGSFASGLDRVPNDGYIARLHKDEAILNSREAAEWRAGGSNRMEALLSELVSITRAGQMITLDSGIMAGQLTPAIDTQLGTITRYKGRGN